MFVWDVMICMMSGCFQCLRCTPFFIIILLFMTLLLFCILLPLFGVLILLFLLAGLYRLHAEDVQHEAIQEELLLHSHAALQVDSLKRLTTIKNYIYLDRRFSFLF